MIVTAGNDIYSDPVTGTLKNRLGITDRKKLEIVASRISSGYRNCFSMLKDQTLPSAYPVASVEFLMDLHKLMMGDVYDWAGKYRKVDVGIEYDHVAYEPWKNVPGKVKEVFDFINEHDSFRQDNDTRAIIHLALVYGNLKNLQPFRDGNTRTAMVYTQFLARESGRAVDFNAVDREAFSLASVKARDGKYEDLVWQFARMTLPANEAPSCSMPSIRHDENERPLSEYIHNRYGSLSPRKHAPVRSRV